MASGLLESASLLRRRMAQLSNTNESDWYLVSKARQGMQVAFSAAGAATGRGEVVTQLFTCVTAVSPILAAGFVPRYADTDPATLAIDARLVRAGEQTCAVVLQNTFGIVDSRSAIALRDVAHAAGALLVEDSAHCVGRMTLDEAGVPVADVSVHSFGVEKMLAGTYFGGAVWVNPNARNADAAQAVRTALASLPPMEASFERATRKYRNQMRILTRLPHAAAQRMRVAWERKGTLEPAVPEVERKGSTNHVPSRPSEWVCEQALAALEGLAANEDNRRACVAAYLDALGNDAMDDLRVPEAARRTPAQPLLRFPVFMHGQDEAETVASAIAELGFYVPAWPRPLLVPGVLDATPFGLSAGMDTCPQAQELSAGVIALPTDIAPARVSDVVRILQDR